MTRRRDPRGLTDAEIVARYLGDGATARVLAAEAGCAISTICRVLDHRGVPRRPTGPPADPARDASILAARAAGTTLRAIAARLGLSHQRVHRLVRNAASRRDREISQGEAP